MKFIFTKLKRKRKEGTSAEEIKIFMQISPQHERRAGTEGGEGVEGAKFRAFFLSRPKIVPSDALSLGGLFVDIVVPLQGQTSQAVRLGFSGVILCEPRRPAGGCST